jgi:hypothetical protein
MKKRYVYTLLVGLPGLFLAGMISIAAFAAFTGILWLYVFGDQPWPAFTKTLLSLLFILTLLLVWSGFIVTGYLIGRKLETNPGLNRNHVLISAGLTLMFILFMTLYQWRIGNIGPTSDNLLCSEFCTRHGYSGSGMPPEASGDRTCSCYDDSGNEALRVPLDHIAPEVPR